MAISFEEYRPVERTQRKNWGFRYKLATTRGASSRTLGDYWHNRLWQAGS